MPKHASFDTHTEVQASKAHGSNKNPASRIKRALFPVVTLFVLLLVFFAGLMAMIWWFGSGVSARLQQMKNERARLERSGLHAQNTEGLQVESKGSVLGEQDKKGGSFIVNIPTIFNSDITASGRTIDLGEGKILASNIISQLLAGTGLRIVPGQNQSYTIVNSDPGSAQLTFGSIKVGENTIAARTNEDTLEFEPGEGLEFSVENGRIVVKLKERGAGTAPQTITNITNVTNQLADTSGFTDTGAIITLKEPADNVALGTGVAQGKLTVMSSDASQAGLVVQAIPGQTAPLTEWKDATGSALISFDANGNAVFKGSITQTGNTRIIGGGLTFNSTNPIIFDGLGDEPGNILVNPGLETNLDGWTASTPTLVNQISNPDFNNTDKLTGWTSSLDGPGYPEQFTNTGFETNIAGWYLVGGGLYSITEFNTPSAGPWGITSGPDGNLWYTSFSGNKIGRLQLAGPERVTTPTYSFSSGAIKLPASGSDLRMTQSVNLPSTNIYALEAYAYRGLAQPVSAAEVVLEVNGTPIPTTYRRWRRLVPALGNGGRIEYDHLVRSAGTKREYSVCGCIVAQADCWGKPSEYPL